MVIQIVPIVKETVLVSQSRPPPLSRVLRSTVRQATTAAATPAVGKSGRAPVVNEDDEKTVEAKRTVSIVVCEQCEVCMCVHTVNKGRPLFRGGPYSEVVWGRTKYPL